MVVKIIKNIESPYKEMALSNQVKQGNESDSELRLGEGVQSGGFRWSDTEEGYEFWFSIFSDEKPEITDEIKSYHPDVFTTV